MSSPCQAGSAIRRAPGRMGSSATAQGWSCAGMTSSRRSASLPRPFSRRYRLRFPTTRPRLRCWSLFPTTTAWRRDPPPVRPADHRRLLHAGDHGAERAGAPGRPDAVCVGARSGRSTGSINSRALTVRLRPERRRSPAPAAAPGPRPKPPQTSPGRSGFVLQPPSGRTRCGRWRA
jgi:hypothetical protein